MGNDYESIEQREPAIEPLEESATILSGRSGWKILRRVMSIILLFICLFLGVAGGIALYISNGLTPVAASDQAVRIEITKGIKSGAIAQLLEKSGLIRNGTIFKYYLRYKGQGNKFQAGLYDLKPGTSIDQIIGILNNGETVKVEMVRFTIPEGYSIVQIIDLLNKENFTDPQPWMEVIQKKDGWDAKAIANIPEDPQLKYRLEGYLFPETYEMKKESTKKDVINRLLEEMDNKINSLPVGWQQTMDKLGVNFHQMITVASLVEREVVIEEERPIIAGIIYNRLAKHMNLQIDATVQYVLGKQKERLLYKDLEIKSPYNTYLHEGLPPGPIASPSLSSIQAAIYPQQTKYLYYVTKKDGSQGHLFAETFKQHQVNINKSNNP